jgi:hypothetical protein
MGEPSVNSFVKGSPVLGSEQHLRRIRVADVITTMKGLPGDFALCEQNKSTPPRLEN